MHVIDYRKVKIRQGEKLLEVEETEREQLLTQKPNETPNLVSPHCPIRAITYLPPSYKIRRIQLIGVLFISLPHNLLERELHISHVELNRPKFIKTNVSESTLFDHLINIWEFNPGPIPGTCDLHFLVDFKFQSPLYRQVASMFFKEVVSRLVGSFSERCRLIYGLGVPVLENSYRQKA